MQRIQLTMIWLIAIGLIACNKEKARPITPGLIEHEGYILTSEQIDNGYFNNRQFYFFAVDKVEPKMQALQFFKGLESTGFGFSLYSSYYVRLINCMGIDLISYTIDNANTDPYKLKIEYWKILPVKISLEYNPNLKNNTDVLKDSVLTENGSFQEFKYRYIGKVSIKSMEILLPKDEDLSGNESVIPIRKFGVFGNEKN